MKRINKPMGFFMVGETKRDIANLIRYDLEHMYTAYSPSDETKAVVDKTITRAYDIWTQIKNMCEENPSVMDIMLNM